MTKIFQILFPSRCGKCLSKVYCSEECWEAGHKGFCSEAVDERKVKQTGKERRQAGKDNVKESFFKIKEAHEETEEDKERLKEIKKMCKEMGRSKKASENGSKAKAAAKK